jgi:hypothetical protein
MEELRIRPEDYHLKYGPLSTILLEAAEDPGHVFHDGGATHVPLVGYYWLGLADFKDHKHADPQDRATFLLFLAEMLVTDFGV